MKKIFLIAALLLVHHSFAIAKHISHPDLNVKDFPHLKKELFHGNSIRVIVDAGQCQKRPTELDPNPVIPKIIFGFNIDQFIYHPLDSQTAAHVSASVNHYFENTSQDLGFMHAKLQAFDNNIAMLSVSFFDKTKTQTINHVSYQCSFNTGVKFYKSISIKL